MKNLHIHVVGFLGLVILTFIAGKFFSVGFEQHISTSMVETDLDAELKESINHHRKVIAQAGIIEHQKIAFDAMQTTVKELGYSNSNIEASPALMGLFSGAVEAMEVETQKLNDMVSQKDEG